VSNPLVSVVIPTFNRAGRLHVSVESVIAQTYRPIELVVIDDGGSDDTPKVFPELEQKAREAGLKTVFERKDNDGCASARNLAMERATGEMIAFLDDDDRWLPDKLAKQVQCMQETGADASCCQTRKLIQRGEIIQPPTPDRLVQGREPGRYIDGRSDAHLITIVLSKALLPKVGTFDTTLRVSSDTEWIARLVHVAEFCAVPEVLAVYEWNPQALSRIDDLQAELKRDEVRLRQLRLIRERCTTLPGWDEAAWKRRAAKQYDEVVKHRLYVNDVAGARAMYEEGMELSGGLDPLPRVKRKLLKARLLGPFGWRLKHPKLKEA
jgi:glycosyltransferase involved in cell wall biosynthesis